MSIKLSTQMGYWHTYSHALPVLWAKHDISHVNHPRGWAVSLLSPSGQSWESERKERDGHTHTHTRLV